MGYQWAKARLSDLNTREDGSTYAPAAAVHLAAGFAADVIAAPLWTPTDVVMQRLQIQGPGVVKYHGVGHAVAHIWQHEGIRGLFRGLGASIIAFGPVSDLIAALLSAVVYHVVH